jgi:hypothetical protein
MSKLEVTEKTFNPIVVDLLVDILATNFEILDKLESISPSSSYEVNDAEYRTQILQILDSKYGNITGDFLEFLKSKGIDKPKNE